LLTAAVSMLASRSLSKQAKPPLLLDESGGVSQLVRPRWIEQREHAGRLGFGDLPQILLPQRLESSGSEAPLRHPARRERRQVLGVFGIGHGNTALVVTG
jgi:hypothetical protein